MVGNGRTGRVARLELEGVDEEVQVDDVALGAVGVGLRGSGESVLADERSVDVVEDVRPDFTDVYPQRRQRTIMQGKNKTVDVLCTSVRVLTEEYLRGFVVALVE